MTSRFSVIPKLALKFRDPAGPFDARRAAIDAQIALQTVQTHQGDGAAGGAGHDLAGAKLAVQHLGAAFGGGPSKAMAIMRFLITPRRFIREVVS